MKVTGMRVWSHLGCSGQKANIFTLTGMKKEDLRHCFHLERNLNPCSSYLVVCLSMVSFRGHIKPEPRPDWTPLGSSF